jgi:hypothetical protein
MASLVGVGMRWWLAAAVLLLAAPSAPVLAGPGPGQAGQAAEPVSTQLYLPLVFTGDQPPATVAEPSPAAEPAPTREPSPAPEPSPTAEPGPAVGEVITKLYLPSVSKPYPPPPNTFFGMVGTSIEGLDYVGGYPGNLDANPMLRNKSMFWQQKTGVNYYRNYGSDSRVYSWRFVNPSNGVFRWTEWDLLMQSAQDHNITLLATIGNGVPAWANGTDPNCTTCWREKPLDLWTNPLESSAWYKYVRAFVERYDGDGINDMPGLQRPIKYYELWNEPDLRQGWLCDPTYYPCPPNIPPAHQFNGSVDDYVRLSRVGYQAIKDADSTATVVGPATAQTAGNDTLLGGPIHAPVPYFIWSWKQWIEAGGLNYVDVVSFTRYPDQVDWDATNYVDYFLAFAETNRGGKPVWLTETGWGGSSTDTSQTKASNFVRFTFQAWSHSFVQRFFWYSYHEPQYTDVTNSAAKALISTAQGDGAIGVEPDPYFHPLYRVVEVLVDVFGAFTADDHPAAIAPNDQVRVYRFDKNGQTVWAAWIKATSGTLNIDLSTDGRPVRKISMFGDDLGPFSGGPLTLGPWPIYLTTDLNWNQNIGRITGRVHTSAHTWGNATVGVTVQAVGPVAASAVTDADGNYVIEGLPEGVYTVTVLGQSTTPLSRSVTVEREAPWGRTSFTIN